jgi:predicted permease
LGALVAAFPNTGFLGVPLLVALLGPSSAGPAIVSIIADLLFTSSLCIALSRLDSAGEHGFRHAAVNAVKGVLANPMPWAVCLGALFSANEWHLPEAVDKTLGLLADAASPVALFTIGAVLARSHARARMSQQSVTLMRDYLPVAVVKLVLHPLLVLLVGTSAIQMGVALDPFALMVVVLVAALPSASNVSMLAERLGANNGRIAQIILVTTALAFLTFSGAVVLLKP